MSESTHKYVEGIEHYKDAKRLSRGGMIQPTMAWINLTNRCPQACPGCQYATSHGPNAAKLRHERVLPLIDECKDLGCISCLLSGGGEPFLHDMFPMAVEHAARIGLSVGIFTNAIPTTERIADAVVDNATFVRVSVDAATSSVYASVRGARETQFRKCLDGVSLLLSKRDAAGRDAQIGLKFLVRRQNVHEIAAFADLAEEIGVDSIQFKPLRGHAADELDPDITAEAQAQIDRARTEHTNLTIRGGMSDKRRDLVPCFVTPQRVIVDATGTLYLCQYFQGRENAHSYGSVYNSTLAQAWFSESHKVALRDIDCSLCSRYDCRNHTRNKEMRGLADDSTGNLDFI